MLNCRYAVAGVALMLVSAGCVTAPARFTNGVATDTNGMTLYTFDKDAPNSGKSVCNGPCAQNWPPLTAKADDKTGGYWSIITRDDGARQWAYKGKPVYRWIKDQKPGDRTGEGVNNAWRTIADDVRAGTADGY